MKLLTLSVNKARINAVAVSSLLHLHFELRQSEPFLPFGLSLHFFLVDPLVAP